MDKAFKQNEITELCDDIRNVLTECEGYIKGLEGTARVIQNIAGSIPSAEREQAVSDATTEYARAANTVDTEATRASLRQTQNRVERIISEDTRFASDTQALKGQVEAVTRVLEEIGSFLETTSLNTAQTDFATALSAASTRWNRSLTDARR